jgi:hypothetical protein
MQLLEVLQINSQPILLFEREEEEKKQLNK